MKATNIDVVERPSLEIITFFTGMFITIYMYGDTMPKDFYQDTLDIILEGIEKFIDKEKCKI